MGTGLCLPDRPEIRDKGDKGQNKRNRRENFFMMHVKSHAFRYAIGKANATILTLPVEGSRALCVLTTNSPPMRRMSGWQTGSPDKRAGDRKTVAQAGPETAANRSAVAHKKPAPVGGQGRQGALGMFKQESEETRHGG